MFTSADTLQGDWQKRPEVKQIGTTNFGNVSSNKDREVPQILMLCLNKEDKVQSSTTPDPGYQWESETSQLDITNESQEVSPSQQVTTMHQQTDCLSIY